MKSILVISVITFVLIFGGIVVLSDVIPKATLPVAVAPALSPEDIAAAERAFVDIAAERDRVQRDREALLAITTRQAVDAKLMSEQEGRLRALVDSVRSNSLGLAAAQERAAQKLAKMYEAMKPDKAAPILASLEMDVILDILRRMKERPAARILANMDAALAAQISARLSEKGLG